MMHLSEDEITVLRALRSTGWLYPSTIALEHDTPGWRVRAVLNDLRRRHLVMRGNTVHGHWGEFTITEAGIVELARHEQQQLRIA